MRIGEKSMGASPVLFRVPFSNIIMRTQRTRWVQKSYFFTTLSQKLCSFNPTDNVYFRKETKKNRCPCNYLGNGSKNVFVRVELIFPLFCLFQGKHYNANRSPQSGRHRWVQCHPLTYSTGQLGSLSPYCQRHRWVQYRMSPHTKVNGTVGFEVPLW